MSKTKFEEKRVESRTVECSGGSMGHPLVYLEIPDGENEVVCPYCSCAFKLIKKGNIHVIYLSL